MPSNRHGDIPLPSGWTVGHDYDGKVYYIDHNNRQTTWIDPRDRYTKAQTFADCIGAELPYGWEEVYDPEIGVYYTNHINQQNQIEDPRLACRLEQEAMLSEYLQSAEAELSAKKDILQVKSQRLALAQGEYNQINTALNTLCSSRSSLSSSGSSASKCDPDILKSDLAVAKNRVIRLKQEMNQIKHVVMDTQNGMLTLAHVQEKLSSMPTGYSVEEARAIMEQLRSIEESLKAGEKEKNELLHSLSVLGEDLIVTSDAKPSLVSDKIIEKTSIASQTDFTGEAYSASLGVRLAELARLKLEYDSAKNSLKSLQHELVTLESKLNPSECQADHDKIMLIQEKEHLLREYRNAAVHCKEPFQLCELSDRIVQLELDLRQVIDINKKSGEERLCLQEERQTLIFKLQDIIHHMVSLESQLRALSASTLSMSSSSSLGSLSTSSKGSLSSLSFTDIYGSQPFSSVDHRMLSMAELKKRVEKLLKSNSESDRNYAEKLRSIEDGVSSSNILSHSTLSLSPRSSLSSLSPPTSTCEPFVTSDYFGFPSKVPSGENIALLPPSSVEPSSVDVLPEVYVPSLSENVQQDSELSEDTNCSKDNHLKTWEDNELPYCVTSESNNSRYLIGLEISGVQDDPLFDVGEGVGNECRHLSAAVSDESVAGDSGVYEACPKSSSSPECFETPQVFIKIRYSRQESVLIVVIEKARHLNMLLIESGRKVCIKVQLLPVGVVPLTCCTHPDSDLVNPYFGESFSFPISPRKVPSKTLQVNIWSVSEVSDSLDEECVGYAQISLADFSLDCGHSRWYNFLSYALLRPEVFAKDDISSKSSTLQSSASGGNAKEESSDESTIISSQTSTLTRNMGPETLCLNLPFTNETVERIMDSDGDDEEEDEDDHESFLSEEVDEASREDFMEEALENAKDTAVSNDSTEQLIEVADKETNTECMFQPFSHCASGGSRLSSFVAAATTTTAAASSLLNKPVVSAIQRSKTFTPNHAVGKTSYICKLNRSGSDSCVPLYRHVPFQRGATERCSHRWKLHSGGSLKVSSGLRGSLLKSSRTSVDLELDLAAQQRRLQLLYKDISQLKALKDHLEARKSESHILDQNILSAVLEQNAICAVSLSTPENRRVRKMIRKVTREIYKLRQSNTPKGQLDIISFREKMDFFLKSSSRLLALDLEKAGIIKDADDTFEKGTSLPVLPSLSEGDILAGCLSNLLGDNITRQDSPSAVHLSPPSSDSESTVVSRQLTACRSTSSTSLLDKHPRLAVLFKPDDQGIEV